MRMKEMIGRIGVLTLLIVLAPAGFLMPAVAQQTDFSGEWLDNSYEEDDRGGPRTAYTTTTLGRPREGINLEPVSDGMLGNYLGIPFNDAGRQKAATEDLSVHSHPAIQMRPHPAQYYMRGVIGQWRMEKDVDPLTGLLTAYRVVGGFGLGRTIWMDGRPHPPDYAEHTYRGFSTGRFERGMLVVTTTHMKLGYHKRNAAPASDQATMTEYFIRHDDRLTHVQFTEDPAYLEEPLVRTLDHVLVPSRFATNRRTFAAAEEEIVWDDGYLPHYPLGTRHTEFADRIGIPFETTQGGSETMYPEYRRKLKEMMEMTSQSEGTGN